VLLIGEEVANFQDWACENIRVNGLTGGGINIGILVSIGDHPNRISNVTIENCIINASTSTGPVAAFVLSTGNGTIEAVTARNVSIFNTYQVGLSTLGNIADFTFVDGFIDTPRAGGLSTVVIQDTTRTSIINSTIGSKNGDAIVIGSNDGSGGMHPTLAPAIVGNTLTGISNNRNGVQMVNVDLAIIQDNVMFQAVGATKSIGITFTVGSGSASGTINSNATSNNLSAMTGNPTVVFAPSQGNHAENNQGSPDYNS